MPYYVSPMKHLLRSCGILLLLAWIFWKNLSFEKDPVLLILFASPVVLMAAELLGVVAKVHFVPEGIAITRFGITVRRLPKERIRFLCGIHYHEKYKLGEKELIAVCDCAKEEGYLLNLTGKAGSFLRNLNLHRNILWLEWDSQRLKAMRKLYPEANWKDYSQDKRFLRQLKK